MTEIDVSAFETKLKAMGAKKVFEGDIQASLFDFPDGRLDSSTSFLRLRSKGEKIKFAFKKHIQNSVANSYDELQKWVETLGYAMQTQSYGAVRIFIIIMALNILGHNGA